MSAALSPLEFRLERLKRFGNEQLDYLKRLYDRRSISERYLSGEFDLHIHFTSKGMWRATYRAGQPTEFGISGDVSDCAILHFNVGKFSVFVSIVEIAEDLCRVTSLVRLQHLEFCDMGAVNTLEPRLGPPNELLFRAYDRKLRALLRDAGIVFGKREDEIIKSAPEVVANLSDQNANPHRHKRIGQMRDYESVRRIRVELWADGIFLLPDDMRDATPEITKVFLCPHYSFQRGVERVRGHSIFSE
jgi:hypothetical protein